METGRVKTSQEELQSRLAEWTRRYRWQRAQVWALRGLAGGLFASWIVTGGLLAHESLLPGTFMILAAGFGSGGALIAGLLAYFWPISSTRAARYFDQRFHLKERVSTALETGGQTLVQGGEHFLLTQQRQDALEAAQRVDWRRLMPMRTPKMEIAAILLILLALAGLFQFGQPAFQAALQYRLEQQALQAQNEKIANLIAAIESDQGLSPEQQQSLTQPLRLAQQDLSQALSAEQGVSILTRAEGQLRSLSDSRLQGQLESLRQLGDTLGNGPLEEIARSLTEGDLEGAAQDLEGINPSDLSPQERLDLAESLEAAASSLQSTQPELSEALRSAAQALRDGDAQAAQNQLAEAAQNLRQTARQAELTQAADQAAAALSEGSRQMAQQSQAAAGSGQVPGASPGSQASNPTPGNSPGEGTSGSSAEPEQQGGPGGGSGQGENQGQPQTGAEAGAQPIEGADGPGDGGERAYEPIYAPSRLGGQGGDEVQLPGSQNSGDEVIGEGPATPGEPGSGQVPYVDVFPEYRQSARQAIESGQVPDHLRSLVRDYFSALEP